MAFTFIGYFDVWNGTPLPSDVEHSRETGDLTVPAMREKIQGLPASLPSTCKLVGSWSSGGGRAAGVMVVEAESFADLQAINSHYRGWLQFEWHPTTTGGVPRD